MTDGTASGDTDGIRRKKRRWWVAALLSFLFPGFGQFYNTDYRAAKYHALAYALTVGLFLAVSILLPPVSPTSAAVLSISLAAVLLVWVVSAVQATVAALHKDLVVLSRYHRPHLLGAGIMMVIAFNIGWWQLSSPFVSRAAYSIPNDSNIPNLLVGDHSFAWKGAARFIKPGRGQIWVFKSPRDNRTDFIRRLIGMPGDRVRYRNGRLYLNGEVVPRSLLVGATASDPDGALVYRETLPSGISYLIRELTHTTPLDNTPVFRVPDEHYFFLGDNRDSSLDSRNMSGVGYVPAANIRDFPTIVYWAADKSRIGRKLQPVPGMD